MTEPESTTSADVPPADAATIQAGFSGVFLSVAPAMFLGALEQTVVAAALPAIAAELGGLSDTAWIVTAYLVAATVAAPLHGRLGDAFGRRGMLLVSLALFAAGSLASALAPNLPLLVTGRALQGLGGGGLMTLAQALIGQAVSPKERGRFQGWIGAVFAVASLAGPLVGGLLAGSLGWRAIFWVNLPLAALGLLAALRLPSRPGTGDFTADVPGTLLFTGGSVALLLALNLGTPLGWASWPVLALGLGAVAALALLLAVERVSADPLIPVAVLGQPVVWRAAACVALFAAALFAAVVQMPMYLQLSLGLSSGTAGVLLIPLMLMQVAAAALVGRHIATTGLPRGPLVLGQLLAAGGFMLAALAVGQGVWVLVAASLVFGLGLGTVVPTGQTVAQWASGPARLGTVTAGISFARSVGGVMGAAIAAALLHDTAQGTGSDGAYRLVFAVAAMTGLAAAAIARSLPEVDLAVAPSTGIAEGT